MNRDFGEKLTAWYARNQRHLPWRNIRNPYKIWLSEIILQQTRVNQGMACYHRFVEIRPDIFSLAKASVHHRSAFALLPAATFSRKSFGLFYVFLLEHFKQGCKKFTIFGSA